MNAFLEKIKDFAIDAWDYISTEAVDLYDENPTLAIAIGAAVLIILLVLIFKPKKQEYVEDTEFDDMLTAMEAEQKKSAEAAAPAVAEEEPAEEPAKEKPYNLIDEIVLCHDEESQEEIERIIKHEEPEKALEDSRRFEEIARAAEILSGARRPVALGEDKATGRSGRVYTESELEELIK